MRRCRSICILYSSAFIAVKVSLFTWLFTLLESRFHPILSEKIEPMTAKIMIIENIFISVFDSKYYWRFNAMDFKMLDSFYTIADVLDIVCVMEAFFEALLLDVPLKNFFWNFICVQWTSKCLSLRLSLSYRPKLFVRNFRYLWKQTTQSFEWQWFLWIIEVELSFVQMIKVNLPHIIAYFILRCSIKEIIKRFCIHKLCNIIYVS